MIYFDLLIFWFLKSSLHDLLIFDRMYKGSVTEVTQQLKEVSMDTKEEQQGRGEKVGAVEGDKGDVKSGVAQGKVDEDGWETVTSKRRGRRKK